MEYALAAAVLLVALAVVLHPLVGRGLTRPPADAQSAEYDLPLEAQRAAIYREIADLQFDRRLGKLDEADFRALHDALLTRAADLLAEEDRRKARLEHLIEREVATARAELSTREQVVGRRDE